MLHLALHLLVPFLVARVFYSKLWLKALLIMLAGMLIDLDHLLATPIYDAGRCSVGFHPLHTIFPILLYVALLGFRRTRLIGLGLTIHIVLDSLDCQTTNGVWFV
ncbi:MAG: DUF6122 family protein [Pseudomonadota bacterium]